MTYARYALRAYVESLQLGFWKLLEKKVTPEPKVLATFKSAEDVSKWNLFSDADFGGKSTVNLVLGAEKEYATLKGSYTTDIEEDSELIRSGFAGMNYKIADQDVSMDLGPFQWVEVRCRGDGHTYLMTMRCLGLLQREPQIWQAPLPAVADEWMDIQIPFTKFVFTNKGRVVFDQTQYPRAPVERVISFGFALGAEDSLPDTNTYQLDIAHIHVGADKLTGRDAATFYHAGRTPIKSKVEFQK